MRRRRVDNRAVREAQLERLAILKSRRDDDKVGRCLRAIAVAAKDESINLLPLAIAAARSRATVGEMSSALEEHFGRYQATAVHVSAAYGATRQDDPEWKLLQEQVDHWVDRVGVRPRLLVCKIGQDGHDRGQRVVAAALSDLGFDVQLAPMFSTTCELARLAAELDVHLVGVSSQAGAHLSLMPKLQRAMVQRNVGHVPVVIGGVVPQADRDHLLRNGVRAIFGPGAPIQSIVRQLLPIIERLLMPESVETGNGQD